MDTDTANLIRTGNIKRISKPKFSDFVLTSIETAKENDHSYSETYWLTLEEMRPELALELFHSNFNPFGAMPGKFRLNNLLAEVYKRW